MGSPCLRGNADPHTRQTMNKPANDNPVTTVGCLISIAVVAIVAIIYGKVDVAAWFKPTPPIGRYQVFVGRVHNTFTADEVPAMIKIDTATGKSWAFFPEETSSGSMHIELANRWEDVTEPVPAPAFKNSP